MFRTTSLRLRGYDYGRPGAYFPTVSYQSERIFNEVYGTGSGVEINEKNLIGMQWVDTGFVEMTGDAEQ